MVKRRGTEGLFLMEEENKQVSQFHFRGREAVEHVVEAQAEGLFKRAEPHGAELPGYLFAAADGAKNTAILIALFSLTFSPFLPSRSGLLTALSCLSFGWMLWLAGRSAWLGWSRLERLHRMMAEEKWEIEHHRAQEREELAALYRAKGFQGKLLEEVLDVLMAENDRTLKVMLQEELGLTLEVQEHPLKQALGAALGALSASLLLIALLAWAPLFYAAEAGALFLICLAAFFSALYQGNRTVRAVVWNGGLSASALLGALFLSQILS